MKKFRSLIVVLFVLVLSVSSISCTATTAKKHKQVTTDLITMVDSDPELKKLLEESIAEAKAANPDPETNPAQSLEEFYDFMDWSADCMPWNVLGKDYPTLYEHVDQSVGYFWFLLDQPLDELKDRGYYYPSLQYHEPIASWCREYADTWGSFLSTPESWNDEYWKLSYEDERFGMNKGWYSDTNIWTSYNDYFSRHLIDPSVRPIADSTVVAPADSKPQGIWAVDDDGQLVQTAGVQIKSGTFNSVKDLIGPDSAYADAFKGGTLTHTFLDVNDYHRYHFPVSGTIKEMRKIEAFNAAGGITTWNPETKHYMLEDEIPGWQMLETRDCIIVDTEEYGLVAILPIGMSQICSCNWEDNVTVGAKVEKGDPMGYFLFGGSDIVMVFQNSVKVNLIPEQNSDGTCDHLLMGEAYATLTKTE